MFTVKSSKKHLCYVNESRDELSLPSFIKDGNDGNETIVSTKFPGLYLMKRVVKIF